MYFGCGGVGGVGGDCGVDWSRVWEGGCGVMSGFFVEMAGPCILVLCSADTCASKVHPVFNHVAPYRYLPPNMCLSVADIVNPAFLGVVVGPGLVSTSPAFMRSSASHPAGPHGWLYPKTGKSGTHCWGWEGST